MSNIGGSLSVFAIRGMLRICGFLIRIGVRNNTLLYGWRSNQISMMTGRIIGLRFVLR